MATVASLDSVEFFLGGNRNLRVYYQFGDDNTVRESCFAQDYGWFIRGNGIISKDAKRNSPITATRWTENPGATQVSPVMQIIVIFDLTSADTRLLCG